MGNKNRTLPLSQLGKKVKTEYCTCHQGKLCPACEERERAYFEDRPANVAESKPDIEFESWGGNLDNFNQDGEYIVEGGA
jgi:hypothetical protein